MIQNINVPTNIESRVNEILEKINEFNSKVLDRSYVDKCVGLTLKLANIEDSKINRGKTNTWAAGITHAIFFVNDTLNKKGIHMDELADFFEVSEGTIGTKSREIRKVLNIDKNSIEWKVEEVNSEENSNSCCSSDCSSNNKVIEKFSKALQLDDVETGASIIRECANELKSNLGDEYLDKFSDNIGISAEGDFYLTVLATLSNYEFAMGNYEESFKIEKQLLELDKADTRNIKHSIVFRALMNKDYDYVDNLFKQFKDDDSVFFKYAKVVYYFNKGDRKNARKYLKKAVKHNFKFIECLIGNIKMPEGEITSYTKGSVEEACLCLEYSLPLWTNEKIGSWLVKAINKVK